MGWNFFHPIIAFGRTKSKIISKENKGTIGKDAGTA